MAVVLSAGISAALAGCGDDGGAGDHDVVADVPIDGVQGSGSVAGTVSVEGLGAVEGSRVIIDGLWEATASNGTYRVNGVAAGTRTVRAAREGYVAQEREVAVAAGGLALADFTLAAFVGANGPPSIDSLQGDPSVVFDPGTTGQVVATVSDPDGDVVAYYWSVTAPFAIRALDGGRAEIVAPPKSYEEGTVTLYVEDGKGASGQAELTITTGHTVSLEATLTADVTEAAPGSTITLQAQVQAPAGAVLEYTWGVDDVVWSVTGAGLTASLQAPNILGLHATVTFRVTTAGGQSAAATVDVATTPCPDGLVDCDHNALNGCEPPASGASASCAGSSCMQILAGGFSHGDGVYYLSVASGTGTGTTYEGYCDMTTDGGGWTLLGTISGGDAQQWAQATGVWSNASTLGLPTAPWDDYKSLAWASLALPSASLLYQRRHLDVVEANVVLSQPCMGGASTMAQLFATENTAIACPPSDLRVLSHSPTGLASPEFEEGVGAFGLGSPGTNGLCWSGEDTEFDGFKGHFFWVDSALAADCVQPTHAGAIAAYESVDAAIAVADIPATRWLAGTDTTATDISFFARSVQGIEGALTAADPGMWVGGGAASSCEEYRNPPPGHFYDGSVGDGVYRVDPDGNGPLAPFDVQCEMSTQGGGWTALSLNDSGNLVVGSLADTNPWTKCEDDSARFFTWTDEASAAVDPVPPNVVHEMASSYINPATARPFTDEELAALRGQITELHPSTRLVAVEADNDSGDHQNTGAGGHEVHIQGAAGGWKLLTPGANGDCGAGAGTYPIVGSQAGHYLWHTSAAGCEVAGDVGGFAATSMVPLTADEILPTALRLEIFTGGGVAFGWERQEILVR